MLLVLLLVLNRLPLGDDVGLPKPNPTGFPRLPVPDPDVLPNPVKSGAAAVAEFVFVVALPPVGTEGTELVLLVVVEEALVLVPPNRNPELLAAGLLNADGPDPKRPPGVADPLDAGLSVSDFEFELPNKLLPNTDGLEEVAGWLPNKPLPDGAVEPKVNGDVVELVGALPNANDGFVAEALSVDGAVAGVEAGGNENGLEELEPEEEVGLKINPLPEDGLSEVKGADGFANPPKPLKPVAGGVGIESVGFAGAGGGAAVDDFAFLITPMASSCFLRSCSLRVL